MPGKVKRDVGRPRIHTGECVSAYMYVRKDLVQYAREKAKRDRRSLSFALAELLERGVEWERTSTVQ